MKYVAVYITMYMQEIRKKFAKKYGMSMTDITPSNPVISQEDEGDQIHLNADSLMIITK